MRVPSEGKAARQGAGTALTAALNLLRSIEAAGYRALIVGGAVRDRVLGLPVKDVDVATDMPLDELGRLFPVYDVGKNKTFGIGVVRFGDHAFEVARFRGATRHDAQGGRARRGSTRFFCHLFSGIPTNPPNAAGDSRRPQYPKGGCP